MMQLGEQRWLFLVLVYVSVALHAAWRTRLAPPVAESQHAYVALEPMQSASPEAMYLDPRAEEETSNG